MKRFIKKFIPPIIGDIRRYLHKDKSLYYFGEFDSFTQAEEKCMRGGYTDPSIIELVDDSTQKVRRGEALFEQDGVCFYEPNNNYELLAALLYARMKLGRLSVLDFGGALGSTFFRYRNLIEEMEAQWCVVEQKHFIDCGRKKVPELSFYYTLDEAFDSPEQPNVLLLHSVLQYLDEPYSWFKNMLDKGFEYVLLDETAFNVDEDAKGKVLLQHVPESIYKVIYPVNLLGQKEFMEFVDQNGYDIMWEWKYFGGQIPIKDGFWFKDTVDKGMLLRKR